LMMPVASDAIRLALVSVRRSGRDGFRTCVRHRCPSGSISHAIAHRTSCGRHQFAKLAIVFDAQLGLSDKWVP